MAKIMGMQENTHKGVAVLFLLLFLLGLFSGSLYITNDNDYAGAAEVIGICSVFGLVPAIIFMYFGMQLGKQRQVLENLGQFLRIKQRVTVTEVAQQYQWTQKDSEDRIVEAISEGHVQGNFDRGTRTFYVSGAQAQMVFVEKCTSCGAVMGAWVSQYQPATCEFCGTVHPPPGTAPPPAMMVPPAPYPGAPSPYPQTAPGGTPIAPGRVPPGPAQPGAAPPQYPAPQAHYPPPQAPPPQAPPPHAVYPQLAYQQQALPPQAAYPQAAYQQQTPPPGASYQTPASPPAPTHRVQRKKPSIRFLFVSASPDGMAIIAFIMIFFGIMCVWGGFAAGGETHAQTDMMICAAVFYVPLLTGGGYLIVKSDRMEKYLTELSEVADYIVTYRRIDMVLLSRKMGLPEEQVRHIVNDVLKYHLLEGYWTPDGSAFAVTLRPEDHQYVTNCPYCMAQGINVVVIRGGSEKCPYCDSVIFFQEEVVS